MITEKNIFEKGMLINLNQGSYAGRKRLSKDQMKDLPTEIVRGVHDLFDAEFKRLLKDISAYDRDTRHEVKMKSVPFPIDGVYFTGSERIEPMIELLEQRKQERGELIEKAVANYEGAIQSFAEKYPDYYEKAKHKYPTKQHFQERFYCKYQFLKISAPGKEDKLISPEVYKKEMEKFRETIQEMKAEVISTIYQELLETTNRLRKQCTDGKPNQRTLNTLNEYLKRIDEVYSDFVDRDDLKKAIKSIKAQVLGVTADALRDNDDTREKFRKGISDLVGEIKNLPNIPLRRAIDF
jgi:hypothetical protein